MEDNFAKRIHQKESNGGPDGEPGRAETSRTESLSQASHQHRQKPEKESEAYQARIGGQMRDEIMSVVGLAGAENALFSIVGFKALHSIYKNSSC